VPISTNSRWTELDQKVTMLEKRQANLVTALKSGREPCVERAVRVLKAPLVETVDAVDQAARKGSWSEIKQAEKIKQLRAPIYHLMETAKTSRKDASCSCRR
jgi:hypothetical protein